MQGYAAETLNALTKLLEKGISEKYEPLQSHSLSLIGCIAEVIGEKFSSFFDVFIGAFAQIINSPENESSEDGLKLSAKAIITMGQIIGAVNQCEDTDPFKASVTEITQKLASLIQGKLDDKDPRDEAIKESLTHCAAFLGDEFSQFMPILLE